MMGEQSDNAEFVRFIDALRPWLGRVVVVGGWAHRLHRLHPLARQFAHTPLMTRDADIAVGDGSVTVGDDIRARLLAAGFEENISGESRPPVTHYQLGRDSDGFYGEFLTPLVGRGFTRAGRPEETIRIAGITAQKLRHLDLLLISPWSVLLEESAGFPFSATTAVRVPNPATYVAQKILIHRQRAPEKKGKDVLYIYDTIESFSSSLNPIKSEWTDVVAPLVGKRRLREISREAAEMFAEVTDSVRRAARETAASSGRIVSSETMRDVCRAGLKAIFD